MDARLSWPGRDEERDQRGDEEGHGGRVENVARRTEQNASVDDRTRTPRVLGGRVQAVDDVAGGEVVPAE